MRRPSCRQQTVASELTSRSAAPGIRRMAAFMTLPSGGVQLTIKNKLLPKGRLSATFDSMAQAESYAKQLEGPRDFLWRQPLVQAVEICRQYGVPINTRANIVGSLT